MTRAEAKLILEDRSLNSMIETCTVNHVGKEAAADLRPLKKALMKLRKELRKKSRGKL